MQTDITKITVGEIVKQDFRTAAVFEKFKIDYCCGGDTTLGDSCTSRNLDIKEIVTEIGQIKLTASGDNLPDFDSWDVTFLCDYLQRVHHTYVRKNVPEIKELSAKVANAHGDTHPFTLELAQKVHALGDDLLPHLLKEENILFPYLRHLWDVKSGKQDRMQAPFGRAANPIRVMEADHDNAGDLLKGINALTDNFTLPEEACNTWMVLYKALKAFEKDLHTHIHLENNILFPKAIALEDEMNG